MLRPLHQDLLLLQSLQKSKNLSLSLSHLPNSLNIILEEKFLFGRGKQGTDAISVCAQSFARRKTKKAHTAPPLQKIFYDIIFSYGCMIGRTRHNPPFLNNRRRRSTIIHYSLKQLRCFPIVLSAATSDAVPHIPSPAPLPPLCKTLSVSPDLCLPPHKVLLRADGSR